MSKRALYLYLHQKFLQSGSLLPWNGLVIAMDARRLVARFLKNETEMLEVIIFKVY